MGWFSDLFNSDAEQEFIEAFEEGFSDGWDSCLKEVGNELLELDDFL